MRPRNLCTITICLLSAIVLGQYQEIISSAGKSFENSSLSISFTLGESIIATHSSGDIMLTQGFQQSKLVIVNNLEFELPDFEIDVFPNPANDYVILQIDKPDGFSYKLLDMHGRILRFGRVVSTEFEIELDELPASIYILNLYKSNNETASYKIIKH